MTSFKIPYLTLGILFNLILQSSKNKISARDKIDGEKDQITDLNIFHELMYIITGTKENHYIDTYKKNVSDFKTCKISSSTYIPLDNPAIIESFNSRFVNIDTNLFTSTKNFIEEYLEASKLKWLLCAIIDTVLLDTSIKDTIEFDTELNVKTKKEHLNQVAHVHIDLFLLSVINYIILHHANNTDGRSTFVAWHTQSTTRSPWKFIRTGLGSQLINKINFSLLHDNTVSFDDTSSEDTDFYYTEPEIIEPTSTNNKSITQILNNPKVVIQNASKIYNIEHVEHLD